ncbi:hypothetical protein NDU88_005604 [Pleurodeles waltl]|uniref:Uncharacterized protein n=1 Tax=Pleurodeles waltl TaxID=8319 RepID=A0AAV7TB34_PLEWA|nr:hypothetical protein NDU88_005604 [Pleurodeles waltl]
MEQLGNLVRVRAQTHGAHPWSSLAVCVATEHQLLQPAGFFIAPKIVKSAKAPRHSWVKPDSGPDANMRNRKQPPHFQVARISEHRTGRQSGLTVEKAAKNAGGPRQHSGCKDNVV